MDTLVSGGVADCGALSRAKPENARLESQDLAVVRLNNVTVKAGKRILLNGITSTISRSTSVALLGHNGAGKTTLIRSIVGLAGINRGGISLLGEGVKNRPVSRLPDVGVQIGSPAVFENMTVNDHLSFVCHLRIGDKQAAREELDRMMRAFDLTPHAKKRMRACSSGIRKRAAIATAMVGRPSVLLLDDPFAELDQQGIDLVQEMIRQYCADPEKTLILATHSMDIAEDLTQRVIFLNEGICVYDGSWESYYAAFGSLCEVRIDREFADSSEILKKSSGIISFLPRGMRRYLVAFQRNGVSELVATLSRLNYRVCSMSMIPLSNTEFVRHLCARLSDRQLRDRKHNSQSDVIDDAKSASPMPPLRKRLFLLMKWEALRSFRSGMLWMIPSIVAFLVGLALAGNLFVQRVLGQPVTGIGLLCSSFGAVLLLNTAIISVLAGVNICSDYSYPRLRFLLVQPVSNANLFFAKTVVWNLFLPIYSFAWTVLIFLLSLSGLCRVFNIPSDLSGYALSGSMILGMSSMAIPAVLLCYAAISMFTTALGCLLKNNVLVISVSIVTLFAGVFFFKGLSIRFFPPITALNSITEMFLAFGNHILPVDACFLRESAGNLALFLLSAIVGLICYSRKRW